MPLSEREARRRLQTTLAAVAPGVTLDSAAVRRVDAPFPGIAYGLQLGQANALLFLSLTEIDGEGWEERLAARLAQARDYLRQFPLARVRP